MIRSATTFSQKRLLVLLHLGGPPSFGPLEIAVEVEFWPKTLFPSTRTQQHFFWAPEAFQFWDLPEMLSHFWAGFRVWYRSWGFGLFGALWQCCCHLLCLFGLVRCAGSGGCEDMQLLRLLALRVFGAGSAAWGLRFRFVDFVVLRLSWCNSQV